MTTKFKTPRLASFSNRPNLCSRSFLMVLACTLVACASNVPLSTPTSVPVQANANVTSQVINFVDIAQFDRDLSASLQVKSFPVDVTFYDKVSPNKMPERLQKWLSVVESDGGKVLVEPPPNEFTPKGPFAMLSLLGTLVSTIKNFAQFNSDKIYEAAKGRNAVIALERNSNGEVVVTKVKFVKRTP